MPGEPQTRLEDVRGPHNVVADFPGVGEARAAISALERGGIEGTHISLLEAELPSGQAEEAPESSQTPALSIVRRALIGGLLGGLVAGAVGWIIGIPDAPDWISALLFAVVFGPVVGGAIALFGSLGVSRAWEHTFEPVAEGRVAVGVHSDDPAEVERGAEILAEQNPLRLNRFGAA